MSDYISEDVLGVILKRLSVKTLIRCRCVCKSWKQLIASKCFILDHLALQKPRFLVKHKKFDYDVFDPQTFVLENFRGPPQIEEEDRVIYLFNCLHGVMCLCDCKNLLILWNPSMHQLLRIPLPPDFQESHQVEKCCGFWIDPCSHDFKIAIACLKARNVALFSSRTTSRSRGGWGWTQLGMGGEIGDLLLSGRSPVLLIDGVAYFLALCWAQGHFHYWAILFFDFLQEKFAALELPDEMERRYADRILIKWQDSLSVAEFQFACCTHPTNYVDLWVMQSGVLWSKMFRIQFAPAPTLYFNCMLESPDGRVLVSAEIEDLRAYHPKPRDGYLSDFALLRSNFIYTLNSYHVYDFVESLVFPDPKCISSDD